MNETYLRQAEALMSDAEKKLSNERQAAFAQIRARNLIKAAELPAAVARYKRLKTVTGERYKVFRWVLGGSETATNAYIAYKNAQKKAVTPPVREGYLNRIADRITRLRSGQPTDMQQTPVVTDDSEELQFDGEVILATISGIRIMRVVDDIQPGTSYAPNLGTVTSVLDAYNRVRPSRGMIEPDAANLESPDMSVVQEALLARTVVAMQFSDDDQKRFERFRDALTREIEKGSRMGQIFPDVLQTQTSFDPAAGDQQ